MVDLKKEIKLSDLFRRGSGPADDASAAEKPTKAPKEKKEKDKGSTFWTLKRQPKEPKEPKPPKEPRARKERAGGAKAPPAPPAVPLMRAFDLLPKESEREQTSMSPGVVRIALALVGLLVIVGLGAGYMLMSGRAKEKQARVDDLRAQLAEVTSQSADEAQDGATTAALTGEGLARTAALAEALSTRVAWDRILREFALVVPDDVWLVTLSTDAGASPQGAPLGQASFSISGYATSHASVAMLISRLSVLPEFASVQLQSSARTGSDANPAEGGTPQQGPPSYNFTIAATLVPGGVVTAP